HQDEPRQDRQSVFRQSAPAPDAQDGRWAVPNAPIDNLRRNYLVRVLPILLSHKSHTALSASSTELCFDSYKAVLPAAFVLKAVLSAAAHPQDKQRSLQISLSCAAVC